MAEDAVLMIHGIEIEPKKSRHFSAQ
ncbi:hypothetical protein CO2235_MP80307 [Cupriavidus oxalaticus]|nr:hypothetical protein CO2235_MP80307 [Cupriavidus oxalaticus]